MAEDLVRGRAPGEPARPITTARVFIAGSPRSGTSILLFAMKQVFGLPGFGESHVMPLFYRIMQQVDGYFRVFVHNQDPMMLKKLSHDLIEREIFRFIRTFYIEVFPQGSWVDKTPSAEAISSLALAESVFPDARLLVTRRTGVEVVNSYRKKFNSTFEQACGAWVNSMRALVHLRGLCRNLVEVDQYDFRNNPREVSLKIASHVGMPEKAENLAQYFSAHKVEVSSTHDARVRLRIADANWSKSEQEYFVLHCGEMMQALGYEI